MLIQNSRLIRSLAFQGRSTQSPRFVKPYWAQYSSKVISEDNFVPTPEQIVQELVDLAQVESGMRVLEPSAGLGNIAFKLREKGAYVDVIEPHPDRRHALTRAGFNWVGNDFLKHKKRYERIVMNPPFSERADKAHVQHAYEHVLPGGKIVAVVSQDLFHPVNTRHKNHPTLGPVFEFQRWFKEHNGTHRPLPKGAFYQDGFPVNVGAHIIVLDKPLSSVVSHN